MCIRDRSVTPAPLTLAALTQSKVYGNTFTFTGNEFSSIGLRNNDAVSTISLTSAGALPSANVAGSPYSVVGSNAVGPGLGNYTISYVPGSLSVTPAALTVTALNQSKVFFLMIRRPPRSTLDRASAASDVYKRQSLTSAGNLTESKVPKMMEQLLQSPTILSLIHISEPTRLLSISYAVFCLKK